MKPEKSPQFTIEHLKRNMSVRILMNRIGGIPMDKYRLNNKGYRPSFNRIFTGAIGEYGETKAPDVHDALQGGYMDRVKFDKWDKVTQKGYAMIEVEGTYVGGDKDGEPFKTRVFSSQKHLVGPVKDAVSGDILAITFKQNGKFRNAIKITNETADGVPAPDNSGAVAQGVSGTAYGKQVSQQVPDPKGEAAKLATKFYVAARAAKIKADDIPEAFVEALQLADVVQDWRDGKGAFAMDARNSVPTVDELEDVPD